MKIILLFKKKKRIYITEILTTSERQFTAVFETTITVVIRKGT